MRGWLDDMAAASQAAAEKKFAANDGETPIHGVDGSVVGYEYDIQPTGTQESVGDYEKAYRSDERIAAEGPEAGHTFCITVDIRGSSNVVGHPKQDGPEFREFGSVMVRAWNLPDALRKAAEMSLDEWMGEEPFDTVTPNSPDGGRFTYVPDGQDDD
jgi:hypothetical protein